MRQRRVLIVGATWRAVKAPHGGIRAIAPPKLTPAWLVAGLSTLMASERPLRASSALKR